jgi:hypothetical protein
MICAAGSAGAAQVNIERTPEMNIQPATPPTLSSNRKKITYGRSKPARNHHSDTPCQVIRQQERLRACHFKNFR